MKPKILIALLILLSIVGVIDTVYLIEKNTQNTTSMCTIENDCSTVSESKWSTIFFVRNEWLGLFYYSALLGLSLSTPFTSKQRTSTFILSLTSIGLIFSAFLITIMLFVIEAFCTLCLISALTTLSLFVVSLFYKRTFSALAG